MHYTIPVSSHSNNGSFVKLAVISSSSITANKNSWCTSDSLATYRRGGGLFPCMGLFPKLRVLFVAFSLTFLQVLFTYDVGNQREYGLTLADVFLTKEEGIGLF